MFDFTPTEEQRALQTLVREFVAREVKPRAAALDAEPDPTKSVPWDIIRAAHQVGLRNLAMGKGLGGGGQDCLTLGMCVEELAVGDLGISVIFAQHWKIMQMFQYAGTEEQFRQFLIPLRDDPVGVMAVAWTEPESGSDMGWPCLDPKGGPKLSCVRDGEDAVLNGMKVFMSNGPIAHLYAVFARTNREVPLTEGLTGFIIPRDLPGVENLPGFTIGRVFDKMGERLASNSELIFENCRVPMTSMLKEWNKAYTQVRPGFRMSNSYAGASTLGVGWAAFERALEYAQIRVQGAMPIIKHDNIAIKLAEMYTELKAAQMMVRRGCWQVDHPEHFDPMLARSVKPFCSEVTMRVALAALNMHGGNGAMKDVGMEKLVRDAIIFLHSDGINDSINRGTGDLLAKAPFTR
jgi:alkylation response protein AidB-like acyl-CoA dehydrogenase